jgi:hypothetical protein
MEDDNPPSIQLVPFVSSVEAQATIVVKSPFSNVEFEHLTNIVWEIYICSSQGYDELQTQKNGKTLKGL